MSSAPSDAEEVLGKAYDAQLMRRLWTFVRPHWTLLALALVLIPTVVAFELALPYLMGVAIDVYITHHVAEGLGVLTLVYISFVVLGSLFSYAQLYALQLVGQRSMHTLRQATYKHVLSRRSAFFDRMPVGRLLTRMTNDVESINEMFASGVITLIADFVKLVAIIVMMFVLNVELTLITFVTLPILVALIAYARRIMRTSYREIRVKLAAMNSHVQEHLSGIRVVQLFRREQRACKDYDRINADHRDAFLGSIRADAAMYAVIEGIGVVSAAAIAWYAGSSIGEGTLTVGLIVTFIEYVNKFFVPVRDFSAKYAVMQSAMAAAERIIRLLDTEEEDAPIRASSEPARVDADPPAIELENVRFSYRNREAVLRGLDLRVPRGQTVAVVGTTGSGKSTIIKLLARLYEPESGHIRLRGVDIATRPARDVRAEITVVNQDVFLFSGTVRDNLKMGSPGASDDELLEALGRVGARDLVTRRGRGLDTRVDDRGENFSAGERQLISFSRALVRNPEILVLDEATAHVDPETEGRIERALVELMRGRTTLVIAHRLSTIRNSDRIVVVSRGQVAEQGTFNELVAQGGIFSRLQRSFARDQ